MRTATSRGRSWLAGWGPFLVLFIVWSLLYLPHLRTSPGWYGDETLTHHTSRNLVAGTASNMALWNTFWHPHYPYQPGYSFLNGLFAQAFGGDILGSRFFNTLLGLLAALALFGWGRRSFGFMPAFFASLMFLCYGQSVIHFRLSYAHNAAGLGLLMMNLCLLRPPGFKNDRMAGCGLLIAAASHPLFVHGALTAALCRITSLRSWTRLFLPAGLCVFLSMLLAYSLFGNWLMEDLVHLKNVYTGRGRMDGSGLRALQNMAGFVFQDWFHLLLFWGLLTAVALRRYRLLVSCLLIVFLLVRNRDNLVTFYYQAVIILPSLCLGWAALWRFLETRLRHYFPAARRVIFLLLLLPGVLFVSAVEKVWNGRVEARAHYLFTQSTDQVEAAALWLNERTDKGDVVAGNANIAWLLKAETVPYLQMITWYGIPTQGYENGNKRERFRFNASLENCRYAVIGDIDRRWTRHEPNIRILMDRMAAEGWPVVWESEFYTILKNPSYQP